VARSRSRCAWGSIHNRWNDEEFHKYPIFRNRPFKIRQVEIGRVETGQVETRQVETRKVMSGRRGRRTSRHALRAVAAQIESTSPTWGRQRQRRGEIWSSMSAILCSIAGSRTPSWAVRRMVSAIDCTCAELTGSGSEATAASRAFFMMLMVSGGKDAFGKSFISIKLGRILRGNVVTLSTVKSFGQANQMGRQSVWISRQGGAQPFTDLRADGAAIDAVDLNTVWILVRHQSAFCCNSSRQVGSLPTDGSSRVRRLIGSRTIGSEAERQSLLIQKETAGAKPKHCRPVAGCGGLVALLLSQPGS